MSSDDLIPAEELMTVDMIAQEFDVPLDTARRWSDKDRRNGFPSVAIRLGKVKFYKRAEVQRWVALYRMTGYAKNGEKMRGNGQRSQGV